MPSSSICLAYYCSGHGYGHATRVSAFTRHLLDLPEHERPVVHIVSSAPEHVFSDSTTFGARYRYAEIDPVIVQPLAYRVDRRKSVDVLQSFLAKKEQLLARERAWLLGIGAHAVLSDAAFLGCLAAKAAGIPSILITNFTFDSVYSYLSTPFLDADLSQPSILDLVPDETIPLDELAPLVQQIYHGYQCADLLVRLPGYIPLPSFFKNPSLPSPTWVDAEASSFQADVIAHLNLNIDQQGVHDSVPFSNPLFKNQIQRSTLQAPLIVRPPSSDSCVYTSEGRAQFLSSIGIPEAFHDVNKIKILVVSFGGQVIKKPSRAPSRASSIDQDRHASVSPPQSPKQYPQTPPTNRVLRSKNLNVSDAALQGSPYPSSENFAANFKLDVTCPISGSSHMLDFPAKRLTTPCQIWVPGAPPATRPHRSSSITEPCAVNIQLPTPSPSSTSQVSLDDATDYWNVPQFLPDSSWIAIVCGVSKEQRNPQEIEGDSELPERFFVAPKDVYMPDLTAIADVLLGKLGYGTVSECVDTCTPCVYVSRPLFIEEHGLKMLLEREGTGIELPRHKYEAGDWAAAIQQASSRGEQMKARKRHEMVNGIEVDKRVREGRALAKDVNDWVRRLWFEEAEPDASG